MMTAALIRRSFLLQELGKPAEDSMLSPIGLSCKELRVRTEEFEVDPVFLKGPVASLEAGSVNRHLKLFHGMVLRFELIVLVFCLFWK